MCLCSDVSGDLKMSASGGSSSSSSSVGGGDPPTSGSASGSGSGGGVGGRTKKVGATGGGAAAPEEERPDERMLECNICLDTAKDAVVSLCGHLFCWPCLHQWLETRPNRQVCPVCKAAIGKDKVIPLYGRGSAKQEDPRNKVPPRPAGHRTEPENTGGFPGFGFGDGFYMSFGIGAFPFGFITSTFNIGDPRPSAAPRGTPQYGEEQLLSKIFLWVAILFIIWLILA